MKTGKLYSIGVLLTLCLTGFLLAMPGFSGNAQVIETKQSAVAPTTDAKVKLSIPDTPRENLRYLDAALKMYKPVTNYFDGSATNPELETIYAPLCFLPSEQTGISYPDTWTMGGYMSVKFDYSKLELIGFRCNGNDNQGEYNPAPWDPNLGPLEPNDGTADFSPYHISAYYFSGAPVIDNPTGHARFFVYAWDIFWMTWPIANYQEVFSKPMGYLIFSRIPEAFADGTTLITVDTNETYSSYYSWPRVPGKVDVWDTSWNVFKVDIQAPVGEIGIGSSKEVCFVQKTMTSGGYKFVRVNHILPTDINAQDEAVYFYVECKGYSDRNTMTILLESFDENGNFIPNVLTLAPTAQEIDMEKDTNTGVFRSKFPIIFNDVVLEEGDESEPTTRTDVYVHHTQAFYGNVIASVLPDDAQTTTSAMIARHRQSINIDDEKDREKIEETAIPSGAHNASNPYKIPPEIDQDTTWVACYVPDALGGKITMEANVNILEICRLDENKKVVSLKKYENTKTIEYEVEHLKYGYYYIKTGNAKENNNVVTKLTFSQKSFARKMVKNAEGKIVFEKSLPWVGPWWPMEASKDNAEFNIYKKKGKFKDYFTEEFKYVDPEEDLGVPECVLENHKQRNENNQLQNHIPRYINNSCSDVNLSWEQDGPLEKYKKLITVNQYAHHKEELQACNKIFSPNNPWRVRLADRFYIQGIDKNGNPTDVVNKIAKYETCLYQSDNEKLPIRLGFAYNGLCHAWAEQSITRKEPVNAVRYANIDFSVGDRKGLMLLLANASPADKFVEPDKYVAPDGRVTDKEIKTTIVNNNPCRYHFILTQYYIGSINANTREFENSSFPYAVYVNAAEQPGATVYNLPVAEVLFQYIQNQKRNKQECVVANTLSLTNYSEKYDDVLDANSKIITIDTIYPVVYMAGIVAYWEKRIFWFKEINGRTIWKPNYIVAPGVHDYTSVLSLLDKENSKEPVIDKKAIQELLTDTK